MDRGKQGLKRSQLTDSYGIPVVGQLGQVPRHPALSPDAGYDYGPVYRDLTQRHITPRISKRGTETRSPIQTDGRWVAERTNSWMNNFGKLRRNTERRRACT